MSTNPADVEKPSPDRNVLVVKNLSIVGRGKNGQVALVDQVSFSLRAGETIGVVGESGSGKTMTALAMMRLLPPNVSISAGQILVESEGAVVDLVSASTRTMRKIRGKVLAMIFQDPMTSLNPVLRVGRQILDSLRAHQPKRMSGAREAVLNLMSRVNIPVPAERVRSFPHQFSGGMRQRIMIAMGVANSPSLLIADEPTTALDVTVQAQILALLREITSSSRTATVLITHNLGIVAQQCSRVIVMYVGRIVEEGPVSEIFQRPQHPYTYLLLRAMPRLDSRRGEYLANIPGTPPSPATRLTGCRFFDRCPYRIERCQREEPPLTQVGAGHSARCWVMMENSGSMTQPR